ncbi:MAG: tryptophanase [bacterium]
MQRLPFNPEPYKIKMTEPIHLLPREHREQALQDAGLNVFNLPAEKVFIDLLTDSGTGAMSEGQWSALMLGDESYAGSPSFFRLQETVRRVMGFEYVLPTHQGRAAENVLHSALIKEGDVIPGNSHFDTTKAHIEYRKAFAVDCTVDACFVPGDESLFKGNIDLAKLEGVVKEAGAGKIPFVLITVTNNSGGGQPVSLENINEVAAFCHSRKLKLYIDAARFAENSWFIKHREKGQENRSIEEIALDIFAHADGATMSAKKDANVNIGGILALRDEETYDLCANFNVLFEGFLTYGGLSGRDMEALAVGLVEGLDEEYLTARIGQVERLVNGLHEDGIPVVHPPGGHAAYLDVKQFVPHFDAEKLHAQALVCELYLEGGVRAVEIGTVLADRDPVTRQNRPPRLEMVRLAIPRRVYTENHLLYVRDVVQRVYERRSQLRGLCFTWEPALLRHFRARFTWI